MPVRDNQLFRVFLDLSLDPDHYVIAGSGPLYVHGIRKHIRDIDVVARGEAWERATTLAPIESAPFGEVKRVHLFDSRIEILNGWFPDRWPVDLLIDGAEIIEGIRFLSLTITIEWKRVLNRNKDQIDIVALKQYLS